MSISLVVTYFQVESSLHFPTLNLLFAMASAACVSIKGEKVLARL